MRCSNSLAIRKCTWEVERVVVESLVVALVPCGHARCRKSSHKIQYNSKNSTIINVPIYFKWLLILTLAYSRKFTDDACHAMLRVVTSLSRFVTRPGYPQRASRPYCLPVRDRQAIWLAEVFAAQCYVRPSRTWILSKQINIILSSIFFTIGYPQHSVFSVLNVRRELP